MISDKTWVFPWNLLFWDAPFGGTGVISFHWFPDTHTDTVSTNIHYVVMSKSISPVESHDNLFLKISTLN